MSQKDRLRQAVAEAGFSKFSDAWTANKKLFSGKVGKDLFISNCNGNRKISKRAAPLYAAAFGHTAGWYLYDNEPTEVPGDEVALPSASILDVPRISWVTAGELGAQDAVLDFSDYPTVQAADLPTGTYIALQVEAGSNSMNKISPPESVIFVNVADTRLVPNACYIIADEQGRATYKRYRPNMRPVFQPASYEDVDPPTLEGSIRVVGRVRRSMIDM